MPKRRSLAVLLVTALLSASAQRIRQIALTRRAITRFTSTFQ